ncbi:MAG: hypothetical protein ACRCWY_07295 [Cellulosilyticaceae bacterium]
MEGKEKKGFWPFGKKENPLSTTEKLFLGVLMLVAVGIVVSYFPWGEKPAAPTVALEGAQVAEEKKLVGEDDYEALLEEKLEMILKSLEGAGQAKVMVTTSTSNEKVLAEEVVQCIQDTDETDKSGRSKSNTKEDLERKVVMQKGDIPFIVKENRPEIEGVLVLAEGADDSNVKNAIIQAVSSVLDVPVHKIAVFKMATN